MLTNHQKIEMISAYAKDYNNFLYRTNREIINARGDSSKIIELTKKLEEFENKTLSLIEKVMKSEVPSFLLKNDIP